MPQSIETATYLKLCLRLVTTIPLMIAILHRLMCIRIYIYTRYYQTSYASGIEGLYKVMQDSIINSTPQRPASSATAGLGNAPEARRQRLPPEADGYFHKLEWDPLL